MTVQDDAAIYEDVKDIDGWLLPEEVTELYKLARHHGGVILEVGTYRGKSVTALVKGALSGRKWRSPQFFSLDIDPSARIHAAELVERRGLARSTLFFHGRLSSFRQQFGIAPTMAFIDGDHTYDGVVADLAELSTFLRPGIPVVFHDYLNGNTPGVAAAVDEWCANGFARFVRTFGCSAQVMTTSKCSGRGKRLTAAEFQRASGRLPDTLREKVAANLPWLVPVVRRLRRLTLVKRSAENPR